MAQPIKRNIDYCLTQSYVWSLFADILHEKKGFYNSESIHTAYEHEILCEYRFPGRI